MIKRPDLHASIAVSIALLALMPANAYDRYNVGGYWADKKGETEKAIDLWTKAVELHESKQDKEVPFHCNNLAGAFEGAKRWSEAEPYRKKAVEGYEAQGKTKEAALSANWYGYDQYMQKKYAEAEVTLRRSIELARKDKKASDLMLNTMRLLGYTQLAIGHNQDGLVNMRECIALRRQDTSDSKEKKALAVDLDVLWQLMRAEKQYDEALTVMREEIAIYEGTDPKSKNIPLLHFYIGSMLSKTQKYAEAKTAYETSSQLFEKFQGDKADWLAQIQNSLGIMEYARDKFAEAEPYFVRAINIYEGLGPKYSTTYATSIDNLGLAQMKQSKFVLAEENFRRGIAMGEKSTNMDVLSRANQYLYLGNCLVSQNRKADSLIPYKKCLELRKTKLSPTNPLVAGLEKSINDFEGGSDSARVALQSNAPVITHSDPQRTDAAQPEQNTPVAVPAADAPATTVAVVPSQPRTSKVTPAGEVPNRPVRDKWALVIGISEFSHPDYKLKFASKDASDFRDFLVKECNFQQDHIRFLRDQQATRQGIMSAFGDTWLPRVVMPDDLVVIFISTHGTPSSRDAGSKNYIVAYDTNIDELFGTGVNMNDLCSQIKERVKTDRVLIVMDTCYSGAAASGAKGISREGANFDANAIAQGAGRLVISSSAPNERSWESPDYNNGIFTYNLIKSLRKQHDVLSAFNDTQKAVQWEVQSNYGVTQTPILGGNWKGISLMLAVPPAEPRSVPVSLRESK